MLVVSRSDVGTRAWHRMLRDGVLVPATPEIALALGVPITTALRALAAAPLLTQRGALTGVAALWVMGCAAGPCPTPVDVAVPRGSHPDPPPRTSPRDWMWHTDSHATAGAQHVGGIAVCAPADAVVAALRRADLGLAIVFAADALRMGLCTRGEVDAALHRLHPHAAGRAKARAVWLELRKVSFAVDASRR